MTLDVLILSSFVGCYSRAALMPAPMDTSEPAQQALAALVARLGLERKVFLLTGYGHWSTRGIPEVGLLPMVISDGPAGVRGIRFETDHPTSSLPAPVALAATWDADLVLEVAEAVGREARGRGIHILLTPTVNLLRTPLGGRGFECFSEDPWLTARIGVAYVRGVQNAGIAACVKHFVANDSETERKTYDARISEAVLRELYLVPFEACVQEADPALVMAAYNSVNGATMTANRRLLRDVLKDEWGFGGVVISDWTATSSTEASALAGLDLVMPGPASPWGDRLVAAVRAGRVSESMIDDKVLRLLGLARRVGALVGADSGGGAGSGQDQGIGGATGRDASHVEPLSMVEPALLRRAAARSFVLLRNRHDALPLAGEARRRIALIGPNAAWPQIQGGGSATVLPVARPDLLEALRSTIGDEGSVELYPGCRPWGTVPTAAPGTLRDPVTGEPGVRAVVHAADGRVIYDAKYARSALTWWDAIPDAVHVEAATVIIRGRYRAAVSGRHLIGAAGLGELAIDVDGERLAEATTLAPTELIGVVVRPPEVRAPITLEAGQEVEVRIENRLPARLEAGDEVEARPDSRVPTGQGPRLVVVRLGIAAAPDEESMIATAVEAARQATAAVVVVGSTVSTESEGYDRDTLSLPGLQDELVRRVAAVNRRTIVIVNAAMPVLMPWSESVSAVLQAWFPGQAMGEALADVLLGAVEPGGRLPVTIPRREGDCPVLLAVPQFGDLSYSEGLLIGYRGYDRAGTEPRFCFGHGLGYTDWEYASLHPATAEVGSGDDLDVRVTIRNIGGRSGREVVQLYLEEETAGDGVSDEGDRAGTDGSKRDARLLRPLRTLAAFASVQADAGEEVGVTLTVPARAFARFDDSDGQWAWPASTWKLCAGRSSRDLRVSSQVTLR